MKKYAVFVRFFKLVDFLFPLCFLIACNCTCRSRLSAFVRRWMVRTVSYTGYCVWPVAIRVEPWRREQDTAAAATGCSERSLTGRLYLCRWQAAVDTERYRRFTAV